MAKKVSIAISHALTVSLTEPEVTHSAPHGEALPDEEPAPRQVIHGHPPQVGEPAPRQVIHGHPPQVEEPAPRQVIHGHPPQVEKPAPRQVIHGHPPQDDQPAPPQTIHGQATLDASATESNPLSMLVNGPNEVFSVAHGPVMMELPDAQKVSRVAIKRHENGDLLITLIE